MTARSKKPLADEALKRALCEKALGHVAFDGFSDRALERARTEVGTDKATVARLFPKGAQSLVEVFSEFADADMAAALAARDLKAMKVRERIAAAVLARLDAIKSHREAARRAAAYLSLPPNLPLATQLLYRTVDSMWRAVGDTSTDFNFYTKRAILAAVWSSTLLRWFNDTSEGDRDTRQFLADRIENVMQFEILKARLRDALAQVPSPASILESLAPRL